MPYLVNIYALAPERSEAVIMRFLNRFVPMRERTAVDYPVPEFSDAPTMVFDTPETLIAYCCSHPEAVQRLYWSNRTARDPHSAHVYFLPAGGMVMGLSVAFQDELSSDRWLDELQSLVGAEYGYWTGECPPEETIGEFVKVAQEARRIRSST